MSARTPSQSKRMASTVLPAAREDEIIGINECFLPGEKAAAVVAVTTAMRIMDFMVIVRQRILTGLIIWAVPYGLTFRPDKETPT